MRPVIHRFLLLGLVSGFVATAVSAVAEDTVVEKSTKTKFPKTVSFAGDYKTFNLNLTGLSMRSKFWVDVYGMAHYMEGNKKVVGKKQTPIRGKNPLVFHSDPPKALINFADAIEEDGYLDELGSLMAHNQVLLRELGVSSPLLETLIQAALEAGADGAKLSGGGRGGNLIALVQPETEMTVIGALMSAGAVGVIPTWVGH